MRSTCSDADLAEVVEQTRRAMMSASRGHAGRERNLAGDAAARSSGPGIGVLGLERVGEPEQALEDRVLEPAVRLAQVDRVLARLCVGVPEPLLGLLELPLART